MKKMRRGFALALASGSAPCRLGIKGLLSIPWTVSRMIFRCPVSPNTLPHQPRKMVSPPDRLQRPLFDPLKYPLSLTSCSYASHKAQAACSSVFPFRTQRRSGLCPMRD